MLPHKIETISPYLRDKSRLFILHKGVSSGSEWIMDGLNKFIESVGEEDVWRVHADLHNREYPDLTRDRTIYRTPPSDILLKDVSRQHYGIEERYRKKLVPMESIRQIMEANYKWHWASSRGLERHLLSQFNRMDNELLNRNYIVPELK